MTSTATTTDRLRFLGASSMRILLDDTASSALAFYEYECEPGVAGAPQHVHHGHDETFFVAEGHFEFVSQRRVIAMPPGAFLYVPRGMPHAFRNLGPARGRLVGTFNPPRFAEYFRELAAIIDATGTAPDHATWVELYGRYDTEFYAA